MLAKSGGAYATTGSGAGGGGSRPGTRDKNVVGASMRTKLESQSLTLNKHESTSVMSVHNKSFYGGMSTQSQNLHSRGGAGVNLFEPGDHDMAARRSKSPEQRQGKTRRTAAGTNT